MAQKTELQNPTLDSLWGAVQGSLRIVEQTPPIRAAGQKGPVPISHAQGQLWLLQHADPSNVSYNLPFAWRVFGPLNVPALDQSIKAMVRRHEILRTTLVEKEEQPEQVVSPVPTKELETCSIKFESAEKQEAQLQGLLRERAAQPFDLSVGPLLRANLIRLSEEEHVLLLVLHHLVMDGASMGIMFRELGDFYKNTLSGAAPAMAALPIQYADYALWQRQWMTEALLRDQFAYWKDKLGGELPILELPADRVRPAVRSSLGATYFFQLSPETAGAVELFRKGEQSTLFNILLAAYKVMLLRYTGQTDLLVGTPMANRNRIELHPLIGFFPHTVVLRTALGPELSFRQCLERVQKTILEAYGNQDVSFDRLLEALRPKRDLSHSPVFQTMFSFQRMPRRGLELEGLTVQPMKVDLGAAKYDLTLDIKETPQGISGAIEYNTDLFDQATAQRMAGHYQNLLARAVANPETPIGHLPMLSERERHQILVDWNQSDRAFPSDECVSGLFEAQVNRTPDAIAIVESAGSLTYAQLNAQANQLAHHLHSLGVGPGALVGICLERGARMVVSLLACLKAGGAYVPLDPAYPPERLGFMLQDCQASVLITESPLKNNLPISGQKLALLDADRKAIATQSRENLPATADPEHLVYVIYTSGSTGRPKGAGVYRRSFSNLLHWYTSEFALAKEDRVLLMSSPGFDLTQKNFFAPLISGGQLHLLESGLFDPSQVVEVIEENNITLLNCTPSAFYPVIERAGASTFERLGSLRWVVLGGEPIVKAHLRPWLESSYCQAAIANTYGPTECTDVSSSYRLTRANLDLYEFIPLGGPIHNVKLAVVDSQQELCPLGIPGELFIGGAGVGAGYLHDEAKTALRFIKNPFSEIPGPRLYKTGDLVRYLPDGTIDFLRRMDHQIKIRGFRVELSEIETALRNHPNVREIVVVAQETDSGEKRLVAFLEAKAKPAPEPSELIAFAKRSLPTYMVPSLFVAMEVLPVTPNGKINRKALLEARPSGPCAERSLIAPRTDTEKVLLEIWKEVLGLSQICVRDNFFELGGHSLLATQVIARLDASGYGNIGLRDLFATPTIAELGKRMAEFKKEGKTDRAIVPLARKRPRPAEVGPK